MSYATLDRHAQELVDSLGPDVEERLQSLERDVALMLIRHEGQLRRSHSLYRHVIDELELAKSANRGLLQQLREFRVAKRAGG